MVLNVTNLVIHFIFTSFILGNSLSLAFLNI